jgi:solute:Na+ symporter, SSS family
MGILTPLDLSLFGGLLLIIMLFGMWVGRKEGTSEDYYLAGKSARWWGVAGSIFGSNISANHMVGMMGVGFTLGFVESQFEITAVVGLLVMCYGFLPVYRKLNVYTLSEYMSRRYNEASRVFYSLIMITTIVVIQMVPAFYIGSRSINILMLEEAEIQKAIYPTEASVEALTDGLGETVIQAVEKGKVDIAFNRYVFVILLMALVTGIYTIVGGLKAVIFTDVAQSILMIVAAIVVAWLTFRQIEIGGWSGMMAKDASTGADKMHLYLPSNHPARPWTGMLTGLMILHLNYWGTNQFIVQRALAARSGRDARIGIIAAGFLKLLIPFISIGTGVAAFYLFQARMPLAALDGDTAFPMLLREVVSPLGAGLAGLVAAGLVGAILSSIDSMLNSGATLITFDVYKRYINPGASDRQLVRLGRWCVAAFVIGSAVLAIIIMDPNTDEHFFTYVAGHQSRLVVGVVVAFSLGMFWKRATPAGGLAAIVSGIVFSYGLTGLYNASLHKIEPLASVLGQKLNFLHAALASGVLSALVLVSVSLATQPDEEKSKLTWTELGGHKVGALNNLLRKILACLLVYALLGGFMVYTALTPALAAWIAAAWTWGIFIHHARSHIKENAPASLFKDDRFWAGLLSACAIFLMFYYA